MVLGIDHYSFGNSQKIKEALLGDVEGLVVIRDIRSMDKREIDCYFRGCSVLYDGDIKTSEARMQILGEEHERGMARVLLENEIEARLEPQRTEEV